MSFTLTSSPLTYKVDSETKNLGAFKDTQGNHYLSNRVPSIGVLDFGAIAKNDTRKIDLLAEGVQYPLMLRSVYAFSSSGSSNDGMTFNVYIKNSTDSLVKIATQYYNKNQMPYQFPYGATIFPGMVIEVKPWYAVDKLLVYVEPVNVLLNVEASS